MVDLSSLIQVGNFDNGHSIVETSITFFLQNPIIKPSRFEALISKNFKEEFQQFQKIDAVSVQVQQNAENNFRLSHPVKEDDTGFSFIRFQNGKVEKVLQGRNEVERQYISFHEFNYTRWDNFLNDFTNKITIISDFSKGLYVRAVGLHYLDKFNFLTENRIALANIFKAGDWLPTVFFNSEMNNYSILTNVEIDGRNYSNRIQISLEQPTNSILISHNIVLEIDPNEASEFLESNDYNRILSEEHNLSKSLLRDILTDEIKKMIKLV